ncbi:MAG: glutathione S-transferase family protein [Alphaproteobacteria bacterium]
MRSLTLYDFPESGNSYKVRLLLSLLDRRCRVVKMDGFKGDSRTKAFKKKNIDQRLPLLEFADGTTLAESNAILFALARDTDLCPFHRNEQHEILRWMFFEQCRVEAAIAVVRFQIMYKKKKDRIIPFEDELRRRGEEALQVMEDHLSEHDYFAGDHFTIADIALYAYTHVAGDADIQLSNFPNILKWITRVEERERFIPFTY